MNIKSIILVALIAGAAAIAVQCRQTPVFASSAPQGDVPPKTQVEPAKEPAAASQQQPINATRAAREEKALQDARRQQISEREAAVAAKEQELKKLSAKIEAQMKSLDDSKKRLDDSMKAQSEAHKKKQDEKTMKMVKLFKAMKSEQAGKMIDTLKEDLALSLLSRMDTKTVAKLAPFISQPRVIKWISDNLQER